MMFVHVEHSAMGGEVNEQSETLLNFRLAYPSFWFPINIFQCSCSQLDLDDRKFANKP